MKNKLIKILPIIFCIGISLVVFIPYLCTNYINNATDISFHLSRLDGLATSIREGNFFPKIYPYKNNGYGYPWPVFYCDLFLIIPAIAINLGFGLINSYKLAMYIPVLLTAINSYFAFSNTYKSKSTPYIAVLCYTCCSFFTNDIFCRSGLGSVWAWAFFPLIFTGAYHLLYEDDNKANWMLIIGFTGLALSHNISFFFGIIVFTFILLCNIKRLLNFRRLKSLIISAFISFGLSAYYLIPMVEFKLSQTFIMDQNYTFEAYKATYLELGYIITNNIILLLFAIVSIFASYKVNKDKSMVYFSTCLVTLGSFLLLSSTKYINLPLTFTQFKSRLLPIAYLCFIYPVISISIFVEEYANKLVKLMLIFFISLYIINSSIKNYEMVNEYEIKFSKDNTLEDVLYPLYVGYNSTVPELVIEPDVDWLYLPATWNYNYMDIPCIVDFNTREVVTCNLEKTVHGDTLVIWNNDYYHNKEVSFPVSYYKGYNIYFIDENSNIKIEKASDDMINGLVKVSVPDNFNGKIVVSYDGTIIQKVAFVISVITLLSTLLSIAYKRIRKIRYE